MCVWLSQHTCAGGLGHVSDDGNVHSCEGHWACTCVSSICGHVIAIAESVCVPVCVCVPVSAWVCAHHCECVHVSLCPCVAACLRHPWCCHLQQLQSQPETAPEPPSLLSFIIICHKREPRRTVINKGHLKYETTTLTLGNISSVEQLVPPLSLWKGVPGAASPCLVSSGSLTSFFLPSPLPLLQHLWSWRP